MAPRYRRRQGRTARTLASGDASSPAPALPHERDESTERPPDPGDPPRRAAVARAHADLADGQVDTDARNRVAERLGVLRDAGPTDVDPTDAGPGAADPNPDSDSYRSR